MLPPPAGPADCIRASCAVPANDGTRARPRPCTLPAGFFTHRRCLECGAASPASRPRASWYRQPVTGAEWLCERCRKRAYQRMQSQQRRAAKAAAAAGSDSGGSSRAQGEQAGVKEEQAGVQQAAQPPGKETWQPGKRRRSEAPAAADVRTQGQQGRQKRQKREQLVQGQQEQQHSERQKEQWGERGDQQGIATAAAEGQPTDSGSSTSSALGAPAEGAEAAAGEGAGLGELSLQVGPCRRCSGAQQVAAAADACVCLPPRPPACLPCPALMRVHRRSWGLACICAGELPAAAAAGARPRGRHGRLPGPGVPACVRRGGGRDCTAAGKAAGQAGGRPEK